MCNSWAIQLLSAAKEGAKPISLLQLALPKAQVVLPGKLSLRRLPRRSAELKRFFERPLFDADQ